MIISILSFSHYPPFLPSFLLSSISPFSRCQKKAGARAKPPSGAQSSGAPAAPPSETGSRGSSIRRASSQAAKSPTPVTSPSETGAVSKGRQTPLFLPSVVVVPCNVQCPMSSSPRTNRMFALFCDRSVRHRRSQSSPREFPSTRRTTKISELACNP